jgi:hypothetical protein
MNDELPFGFQNPHAEDFGMLAGDLLAFAESKIGDRRRQSLMMLFPSLVFFFLFAFGFGSVLWTMGIELKPVSFIFATSVAFLLMAGLGVYYQEEADWEKAAHGVGRVHRRFLGQAAVLKVLTSAFFILPARVMRCLSGLFPRRPRLSPEVLSIATNLAVALDETIALETIEGLLGAGKRTMGEVLLLLRWAGVATISRRRGKILIEPAPRRDGLLEETMKLRPFVICVSALHPAEREAGPVSSARRR